MTFNRTKNLGLALLAATAVGAVLYLYFTVKDLTHTVADITVQLVETERTLDQFEAAVDEVHQTFSRYRSRMSDLHLYEPVDDLHSLAGELAAFDTAVGVAAGKLLGVTTSAAAALHEFVAFDRDDAHRGTADESLRLAKHSLSAIRSALHAVGSAATPEQQDAIFPLLQRASALLLVASDRLQSYAIRDRIELGDATRALDRAREHLVELRKLAPATHQSLIDNLDRLTQQQRAVFAAYEYDEALAAGDGNMDTLQRLEEEAAALEGEIISNVARLVEGVHEDIVANRKKVQTSAHFALTGALWAAITTCVLALGLALFLGRSLSASLHRLALGTSKIAEGDYEHRLPAATDDDLGRLAGEFNRMAATLKQREQESNRFAEALRQAPDAIAILESSGQVSTANEAFRRLFDVPEEALETLTMASLFPRTLDVSPWETIRASALAGNRWAGTVQAARWGGESYQAQCSVAPIRDKEGTIVNLLVVTRDITRELQMDNRIRESQKLEALGTLAGGIAHDFNNLMTPIMSYSELLLSQAEPGSKPHRWLTRINEAAGNSSALVKQILAFSRPGTGAKQPLALASLTKECIKLFQLALPPDLRLEGTFDKDLPDIVADPTQIHQVLMNLLTNARHSMQNRGGVISCRISRSTPHLDEVPDFRHVAGQTCLCLAVRDEGHGISEEVRPRIFDPFFSTKGLGEGSGMGLSVVRGIVEEHGGAITVESTLGLGSTFRVFLPVNGTSPSQAAQPEVTAACEGSERVLIVERDSSVREALCDGMKILGYQAAGAADGPEAKQCIAEAPARFDAVVLEEQHLRGPGEPLLETVRGISPGALILVSCAGPRGEAPRDVAEAGADGILLRPLSPQDIGAAIRNLLTPGVEPATPKA